MTQLRKVPFQQLRLYYCGVKFASGKNNAKNQAELNAYSDLLALCAECLVAVREGPAAQAAMLTKIETLQNPKGIDALEAMLNGTHPDTPEWLRK